MQNILVVEDDTNIAADVKSRPALGLLPAAISTGIGSESQKPLAIVIIGGLVTATIFTLLAFPVILLLAVRKKHVST